MRHKGLPFSRIAALLLVKQYPTGRIVLVMDNVSYHKSASALAALSLFEHRVMVFWLPTYCSDLNPIERFWRYLKGQACANHLEDNIVCVLEQAEKLCPIRTILAQKTAFTFLKTSADN